MSHFETQLQVDACSLCACACGQGMGLCVCLRTGGGAMCVCLRTGGGARQVDLSCVNGLLPDLTACNSSHHLWPPSRGLWQPPLCGGWRGGGGVGIKVG